MDDNNASGIGARIAALRRAHKMTQDDLAEKLDISTKHISHVERGCSSLSLKNLVETGQIFQCSMDYLILGECSDKALSQLPDTIIEILHSGNDREIDRLVRYLKIYEELYRRKPEPK